jgi:5S rRNA maturation endonuclease (ribonuclease M5)
MTPPFHLYQKGRPVTDSPASDTLRDRLKQAIDPNAFKLYLPDLQKDGNGYKATCPFHADSHPSLSVQFKRGTWLWNCFPCQKGSDLFGLVKEKFGLTFPQTLERIAADLNIVEQPVRFAYDPATAQDALQKNVVALAGLADRGISAETAKAAGLGLVQHPGIGAAISIPYSDSVIKMRAVSPRTKGDKFRHLNNTSSAALLYGIRELEDPIFGIASEVHVTESELDALTMRQAGFTAVSVSSATTCLDKDELRLDPAQFKILESAEKIFLWTDQDEAGNRCATAFEKVLPAYKTFRVAWPYRGKESGDAKDVGELYQKAPEDFRQTVRTMRDATVNRPPKWRTLFKSRSEMDTRPMQFIVESFLPEGVTFLGALSGSGKTWLCLSLAKAICTGQKFLGHFAVPEARNVLYLIPESGERSFRARMDAMGIPDDKFLCRTMTDGLIKLDDPNLVRAVRELRPVVFLDTAIRFSDAENENDASQSAKYMATTVFELLGAGAAAVVGVHHSAKSAANKARTLENALRGSGDLGAMSDAVYSLTVQDAETSSRLHRLRFGAARLSTSSRISDCWRRSMSRGTPNRSRRDRRSSWRRSRPILMRPTPNCRSVSASRQ